MLSTKGASMAGATFSRERGQNDWADALEKKGRSSKESFITMDKRGQNDWQDALEKKSTD